MDNKFFENINIFGYLGGRGGGGGFNNQYGSILVHNYNPTISYINLHEKYGSNQILSSN